MSDTQNGPVLFAYKLDGHGGSQNLETGQIESVLESAELGWAHLDANHPQTRQWLEENIPYLDPLILQALLAKETRPRMVEYDKGLMIILRGVNTNPESDPEDMVSLRIWIDEHRIITTRLRYLTSIREVEAALVAGKGPKDSGEFLSMLCARLFEKIEPVIADLDDHTDDLEEQVMEEPNMQLRQDIVDLRKTAITLRRYIAPQKDVMGHIRTSEQPWLNQHDRRSMQENFDRTLRFVEDLDAIRERAQIIKDELANALSDRINKNMYVLSIIAAIFLPLGFLTGLLGINVGGIPGADNDQAFMIFMGILIVLVGAQIWLFKKMKWF